MSATLEPIYGMPTQHVIRDGLCAGILIPPQTPDDAWEYWDRLQMVPQRFDTEADALVALGIIQPQQETA